MGIVPQGYTVTALGTAVNGWVPVNYNGIRGYISQDYLKTGAGMSTDSSENIANNNRVNTPSSNTENADQSQNAQMESWRRYRCMREDMQNPVFMKEFQWNKCQTITLLISVT